MTRSLSPSRTLALSLAAVALCAGSAAAQIRFLNGGVRDVGTRPIDPRIAERLRSLMKHLADLPDGSFIGAVNGRGAPVVVRNGMTLTLTGKGFDQRRSLSLVALFPQAAGSTGAMLKIVDWSDTRITAVIPADQTWLPADTDTARLVVQTVRASGVEQELTIPNVRFRTH
jgi:hypothetical protein